MLSVSTSNTLGVDIFIQGIFLNFSQLLGNVLTIMKTSFPPKILPERKTVIRQVNKVITGL